MFKMLRQVERHMIRAIVYKSSSRLLYTLTAALIFDRFFNRSAQGLSACFVLLAIVFAIGAWAAVLRHDGVKVPRLPELKLRRKEKPDILYGDMIDYVDEPLITFAELDDDEQEVCLLVCDLICAAIYLVASLFV